MGCYALSRRRRGRRRNLTDRILLYLSSLSRGRFTQPILHHGSPFFAKIHQYCCQNCYQDELIFPCFYVVTTDILIMNLMKSNDDERE
jgi:hypothetical protein